MIQVLDDAFYTVDYKYELKRWLEEDYYLLSTGKMNYGTAIIVGMSYTDVSFKDTKLNYNYGTLNGNVYEIEEPNNYDVKVNLIYNKAIVDTINTTDGGFNFNKLNPNLKYNMEFIDSTDKYNSKLLIDVQPYINDEQDAKIIMYDTIKTISSNGEVYIPFGIVALGNPVISLDKAPNGFVVVEQGNGNYAVKGKTTNRNLDFDILLDDYREGIAKSDIANVKISNVNYVQYLFKNNLKDVSGTLELIKVGNPVITANTVEINGKANTVNYSNTGGLNTFVRSAPYTIVFDMLYKGNINNANYDKIFFATVGQTGPERMFKLGLNYNTGLKYLRLYFSNESGTISILDSATPSNEILPNNRYKIKIVYDVQSICVYVNGVVTLSQAMKTVPPAFDLTERGPLTFGYTSYGSSQSEEQTIFDMYEFKIVNGIE